MGNILNAIGNGRKIAKKIQTVIGWTIFLLSRRNITPIVTRSGGWLLLSALSE